MGLIQPGSVKVYSYYNLGEQPGQGSVVESSWHPRTLGIRVSDIFGSTSDQNIGGPGDSYAEALRALGFGELENSGSNDLQIWRLVGPEHLRDMEFDI